MKAKLGMFAFVSGWVLACTAPIPSMTIESSQHEDVGEASAAITQVPANVACVDIQVASGQRIVDRQFDVTPGQGALLTLQGLPLGTVTFTGLAFPTPCARVNAASIATFATDPLRATLQVGVRSNLEMAFHVAGSATVGIDFDDAGTVPEPVAVVGEIAFPVLFCGADGSVGSFTVQNLSRSNITATIAASTGALFTINGAATPSTVSLLPGATASFQVKETTLTAPHAIGLFNSSITVTTTAPGDSPHTIPASVFVGSANFAFSAPTLSGTGTITLTNNGNEPAGFNLTAEPGGFFSSITPSTGTLAAGASVSVSVRSVTPETIHLTSPNELCQIPPSFTYTP